MENVEKNNSSAFGMLKILMGFLMMAAALFLIAFFLLSCNTNETSRLLKQTNINITTGIINNTKIVTIE